LSAFSYVAASTGARRGEMRNLSWSDVDLAAGALVITGSASVVEGQRIVGITKGGRRRTVSIDPSTVRALQARRWRQAEERLLIESDWPESDLVFRTDVRGASVPGHPRSCCRSWSSVTTANTRRRRCPRSPSMTSGTSTRRRCSWPVSPSMWSPLGWALLTRPSRCASTPR
jgi:integrase